MTDDGCDIPDCPIGDPTKAAIPAGGGRFTILG